MSIGRVYLVGAGPGDPDLITVKGLRLLESADVIVHDRLIDRRLLDHSETAELINVGKVPGREGRTQRHINDLLVSRAREGQIVVRLKGGDPFVFGRGGEEAEALVAAGVTFEIVPGVTSAVAAPTYAGIPLTHRNHASSFTVITGSLAAEKNQDDTEWDALARVPGTLVFLMGWRNLGRIVDNLVDRGKAPETPAAVVTWGTQPWQRSVTGELSSIVELAEAANLSAPATVVVGEVARLRETLNWFETRPLFGRRILVTRTRNQAGQLSQTIAELGAYPIEVPTIAIRPLDDYTQFDSHLESVGGFDWVVFTSANAVGAVLDRLRQIGRDSRALSGVKVAAIGDATGRSLIARGIHPDLLPERATSGGLAQALVESGISGRRILLPRADIATSELPDRLTEAGAVVTDASAYRTVIPDTSRQIAVDALANGVDLATFTSSSTVRNLLRLLNDDLSQLEGVTIACIGPVTAEAAGRLGLNVDIVAEVPTIPGLVDRIAEYFANQ